MVLIGGSYIACEVAASLTTLGKQCTLVMLEDAPLSTGFGTDGGRFFQGLLGSHGIEFVTGDGVARFEGEKRVERVVTESGKTLDADLVVIGAGAHPDVMLARSAGLELGETGGVKCSQTLATSAPGIWCAGDPCEYDSVVHRRRLRVEHFEVAAAQGRYAASAMTGDPGPTTRCPTSGPTSPTGRRSSTSGRRRAGTARSCAARSTTASSRSSTSTAAGSPAP